MTQEASELLRHTRRANDVFLSDIWGARGRDATLAFVRPSLEAKKAKEKVARGAQPEDGLGDGLLLTRCDSRVIFGGCLSFFCLGAYAPSKTLLRLLLLVFSRFRGRDVCTFGFFFCKYILHGMEVVFDWFYFLFSVGPWPFAFHRFLVAGTNVRRPAG